ncbi:MAG: DUF4350 domain-containing protein [Rhodothermales bacterium]
MRKQDRKYVVVLALAFLLAVAVQVLKPEPIDWSLSYENDDTRPYGSLILYELLSDLFPGVAVREVDLPPYLVLRDTMQTHTTYLFITDRFAPDPAETEELLDFVARGNQAFVAAFAFEGPFADTLRLETEVVFTFPTNPLDGPGSDSAGFNFVNPRLRASKDYTFAGRGTDDYFARFDTLRSTVLGVNSREDANYLRVDIGEGALYLSTVPPAFTNYTLLDSTNAAYVYGALSYLPDQEILWDEYYKPQRLAVRTPLRYILRDPSLKGAYWVLITLVVLFVLFEAKRRQRIIPVIEPLRNTTVEFVKTVGRLYHQHADHARLAEKKITYFLDYVRQHLRLPTRERDEAFLERVSERSGVPGDAVREVFQMIGQVQGKPRLTEAELRRLTTLIDGFYQQSKR